MNVWRIAMKELMTSRDPAMLIFMLATPVLLILILGSVLSGNFNGKEAVGTVRVLYSASGDEAVKEHWESWIGRSIDETDGLEGTERGDRGIIVKGIAFDEAKMGEQAAIDEVKNGDYIGYATIGDEGIRYYGNDRIGAENAIVQGLLLAYADHRKLSLVFPEAAGAAEGAASSGEHFETRKLQAPPKPNAIDYYSVAVTTMIIMYISMTAGLLIENERVRHTANRLLVAPVTKAEIFAGKITGSLLLHLFFVILIVLLSKYMYGADWGDNPVMVLLVLASQIVFAISLGLGSSYMLGSKASGAVIMTIIQLAALFGGSYFQNVDNGDSFSKLTRFSPLDWTNDGLLSVIYGGVESPIGGMSAEYAAILLNMGFSVLFLAAAIGIMRRKEGL
ncbi:hypothetical protein B1748_12420 [Paenibacillus sp. MY03]|uniref:ABC transporter permease n=1 Tax=Paenibacillus sp. MY03 TaxID=302980 RepID=UPI000B3C9270|nr:ABC transporter permease [Paenibacillus sp. MY03]OUS76476.1 hypothetical protein B1748_12420 [Paenibacillus sp. MY03]